MNLELERQLLHAAFGLVYILMLLYLPKPIAVQIVFLVFALGILVSVVHHRFRIEPLERLIARFEREGESRILGDAAIKFTLGVLVATVVFYPMDTRIILGAISVLTFGDSASTIIGQALGKIRVVRSKTLEGTIGGILVGAISLIFFLPVHIAIAAAVAGMLAELLPVNDNYTIPLTTGATIAMLI